MSYDHLFPSLSDEARLWVYATDHEVSEAAAHEILVRLRAFIDQWQSHGRPVRAESTILYRRFILLAAEIPDAEISGCGIDASVHALEQIGADQGFSLLTGLYVFYRGAGGEVLHERRAGFRKLVREGKVNGDTVVFDPSITHLAQLKNREFERPALKSWHATVFRIAPAAV